MNRLRTLACIGAAAAAVLGGCGGDDDEPASAASTTEEATSTTTGLQTTTEEVEPDEPQINDQGHEGGGPDPGTAEAEAVEQYSGGTEAEQEPAEAQAEESRGDDGPGSDSTPTESFDQFCEQNPGACD